MKVIVYSTNGIDELRKLRNALIHINAGKLSEMARKSGSYLYTGLEAEFYLNPILKDTGINKDAYKYLVFTRKLIVKFYGA